MTLLPGDVILTGTPAGSARWRSATRSRVSIEGIGALTNPVVSRERRSGAGAICPVADRLSSTSAAPARRCSTGCSPASTAARSAAHRGHRRRAQPARADRHILDMLAVARPRLGRGPVPVGRALELHRAAAGSCSTDGLAYCCDCTPETGASARTRRHGTPGYDGFCRDRGLEPGEGGPCGSARPTRATTCRRRHPRPRDVRERAPSRTS